MKQHRRRIKAAQHHEALAEAEQHFDTAFEYDLLAQRRRCSPPRARLVNSPDCC